MKERILSIEHNKQSISVTLSYGESVTDKTLFKSSVDGIFESMDREYYFEESIAIGNYLEPSDSAREIIASHNAIEYLRKQIVETTKKSFCKTDEANCIFIFGYSYGHRGEERVSDDGNIYDMRQGGQPTGKAHMFEEYYLVWKEYHEKRNSLITEMIDEMTGEIELLRGDSLVKACR